MTTKSFYAKYKNHSQEKLNSSFNDACSNGDLDEIKYLLTSPELKEHADIHYDNDIGLSDACWAGHLEVVKFLLTSPDLKEHAHINDNLENDCGSLLNACGAGHIEIVKYLLTSPDLKEHAIIDWQFMPPLGAACESGHLEIVKYLLNSPDIKEHPILNIYRLASCLQKDHINVLKYLTSSEFLNHYSIHDDNDILFKRGIHHTSKECIKYLIFDLNIDLTDNIKNYLEFTDENKKNHNFIDSVKKMFTARELALELGKEIPKNEINNNKKVKL